MVWPVIFINLFFVPMLPLYVIYKKENKLLKPNLDLLFQYAVVAAYNIPLTKVLIFLMGKTGGIYISKDSGYYTAVASLAAFLLVLPYKFYIPWRERIIQKGIKRVMRDLAPACILLFAGCFMLLIFEPILMYATNIDDFWFDFQIMTGPVLIIFAGFFLTGIMLIFIIYSIDLLISKRLFIYNGITLTGFIAFFLLYLQGNWLAGNLPPLTGEEIVWANYGKYENLVLISALIILAVVIAFLIKKHGLDRTALYTAMCASIIFVMLFASLVPAVIANNALDRKDTFSATLKNFNTVSSNKNFLIFLIDSTNSERCYNIMMEDDDFRDMMEDFTYYPDTLGMYPYTRDAIPQILTGKIYRNEAKFTDYCSSAYNQSLLFENLTQNEYEINLYSTSIKWKGERNYNIENSTSIHNSSVDLNSFMKQELKYVAFKYLPYGLKRFSKVETIAFGECQITNSEYARYSWGNIKNYERFTEDHVLDKQSQNYFQFVHCEGAHDPVKNMDKYLNTIENGSYEQKIAASLTVIKAYLQRLKDNDAYDNSAIVIMSDHEYAGPGTPYDPLLDRFNPILFIKGTNEKHDMLVSDRSVSYVDLQDAFSDLMDGKQSTELFADLEPGRTRTVIWQAVKKEEHKVEYELTGKAWETDKLIPTGNVYDLEK